MPYALIESMMCGRPTICVDDGALAPMVGMGAVLVPPDDPVALAEACVTLLGRPTVGGSCPRRRTARPQPVRAAR